jgi:PTH2 family peptidyl-tRNA hydrolase
MSKQVLVVRKDLNMRKGKMAAQAAHASLAVFFDRLKLTGPGKMITDASWRLYNDAEREWIEGSFAKICVGVDSEEELLDVFRKAKEARLLCSIITDAGKTEFKGVPTKTCVAIGPDREDLIDTITGHLRLL